MRGGYALVFEVPEKFSLKIGKKHFVLKPGAYIYSGSALNGVEQRVNRHLRIFKSGILPLPKSNKPTVTFWHIDYLLPNAINLKIIMAESKKRTECEIVQQLKKKGMTIIKGFGDTDCNSRCEGHLLVASGRDIEPILDIVSETFKNIGSEKIVVKDSDKFR